MNLIKLNKMISYKVIFIPTYQDIEEENESHSSSFYKSD